MENRYREIENIEQLRSLLKENTLVTHCAFQKLDFSELEGEFDNCHYSDCIFLGCKMDRCMSLRIDDDCLTFPEIEAPYTTFRSSLYTPEVLFDGYCEGNSQSYSCCYDGVVYEHFIKTGKFAVDIKETLARTLHDHSISNALCDFLLKYDEKKIVGVMGGHGLLRTDAMYALVVKIAKQLTEEGFLMVSGGGPGAMEATHLGAWLAGRTDTDVEHALEILSSAAEYSNPLWLDAAMQVRALFPQEKYRSLGVPTWLYGHEKPTPFATDIAKYFDNAIREDTILTIAKGGIIFSPGSAGTMQELFQESVQNHYLTLEYASPMILLGSEFWQKEMPMYPLFNYLIERGKYKNLLLSISDSAGEVIERLKDFSKR